MSFQESKTIRGGVLFLFFFLLTGCPSRRDASSPDPITTLIISPGTPSISMGKSLNVSAIGVTASGVSSGTLPVSWTSDDTSVATVTPGGVVEGIGIGVTTLSASYGGLSAKVPFGVTSTQNGVANISVSGTVSYQDKQYTETGFTGITVKPIRQAVVNLIAIDGFTTLMSTTTEENGSYRFSTVNNSARKGGIYVQVLAKTDTAGANPITVMDNAISKSVLAVSGAPMDDSSLQSSFTSDILAPASGIGGAFNILDTFLRGGTFIQNIGACPLPNTTCKMSPLTAYWTRGRKSSTFYESPPVNAITINGGETTDGGRTVSGDTDEYDDPILAHEYGHFLVALFSRDQSPGGGHNIADLTQDIRLAWSEGWATFFSAAMLGSPLYVDTQVQSAFSINLETYSINRSSSPAQLFDTTNEVAIAGALWDMFDTHTSLSQDDDSMTTTGFYPIWQSVMMMKTLSDPATMELFVTKFIEQNPGAAMQPVLQSVKIELFLDTAEQQEMPLSINQTPQSHTLYGTGQNPFTDEDIIPITTESNKQYTVRTSALTNGADTFLTLEGPTGVVIQTNDNADGKSYPLECYPVCPPNGSGTLSSAISFRAGTESLFVRVKRSPFAPYSTGRAGSYNISLTLQ